MIRIQEYNSNYKYAYKFEANYNSVSKIVTISSFVFIHPSGPNNFDKSVIGEDGNLVTVKVNYFVAPGFSFYFEENENIRIIISQSKGVIIYKFSDDILDVVPNDGDLIAYSQDGKLIFKSLIFEGQPTLNDLGEVGTSCEPLIKVIDEWTGWEDKPLPEVMTEAIRRHKEAAIFLDEKYFPPEEKRDTDWLQYIQVHEKIGGNEGYIDESRVIELNRFEQDIFTYYPLMNYHDRLTAYSLILDALQWRKQLKTLLMQAGSEIMSKADFAGVISVSYNPPPFPIPEIVAEVG